MIGVIADSAGYAPRAQRAPGCFQRGADDRVVSERALFGTILEIGRSPGSAGLFRQNEDHRKMIGHRNFSPPRIQKPQSVIAGVF